MLETKIPAHEKRANFRAALASGTLLRMPGAFNPLSAQLIQDKGFEGVYVSGAVLSAEVRWREFAGKGTPAWKYLTPEIDGGPRRHKSHELRLIRANVMRAGEFAVPGAGVTLDAYGNMPGSLLERILSQLQAAEQWAGYSANQTKRSRARRRKGSATYFLLRGRAAPDGIYQRNGRRIIPVLIFVRSPTYGPRFPAYARARGIFEFNGSVMTLPPLPPNVYAVTPVAMYDVPWTRPKPTGASR